MQYCVDGSKSYFKLIQKSKKNKNKSNQKQQINITKNNLNLKKN